MLMSKKNKNIYEDSGAKPNIFSNVSLMNTSNTDKLSYLIRRLDQTTCNLMPEQSILDTNMVYLGNLLENFYNDSKHTKLLNLQADWIQDPKGNFFLINVKNYQFRLGNSSLLIDRPISLTVKDISKKKQEASYTETLIRRSLSPPYCFTWKNQAASQQKKSVNKSFGFFPVVYK